MFSESGPKLAQRVHRYSGGSVLSPLLWNVIYNAPLVAEEVTIIGFADDLAVINTITFFWFVISFPESAFYNT